MRDANELSAALGNFYNGTEQTYFNRLYPNMKYSDGVKFFAENAGNGAYWFLDICGTEIHKLFADKEDFIVVLLQAFPDAKGRLVADDGNGNVFWSRDLNYTDCPTGEWKFYIENDLMCLPGER